MHSGGHASPLFLSTKSCGNKHSLYTISLREDPVNLDVLSWTFSLLTAHLLVVIGVLDSLPNVRDQIVKSSIVDRSVKRTTKDKRPFALQVRSICPL